ncbi:MAG: hypothetical protein HYX73_09830 [Acidobacteria bacterium]|nr:hypothetical protein [Acidobacteriota bacterium]
MNQRFHIEYDPRLVEEAVLLRIAGGREEKQFRRARDLIYEVENVEEREDRFRQFHAEWFLRLGLGAAVREALAEQPAVMRQVRRCCVLRAPAACEEGADLHELRDTAPRESVAAKALLIRLKPERLLDSSALQGWLRHELTHIDDMLDPRFGYERFVPPKEASPAYSNLLRERYRVLWDTWIDGRLSRRGWLPEGVRTKRLEEFIVIFSALGQDAQQKFDEIFRSEFQTHARLMTLALDSRIQSGTASAGGGRPQPCPLCRFPTYQLLDGGTELPAEIMLQITADFPDWQPTHGCCQQCAGLYGAMEMSRSAEALLPKI